MLLKSIKLENIRSYNNQEIIFPSGSLLLSGDIGSGKSTILLGVEFALFGIRRKHLSGGALLRNGRNNGSVELKFEVDSREVIIKRILKRGKDKVEQISGYIVVDGVKQEATAVELKTKILELLGYPQELVTKTKNLVFRYTVYTPQEEMKQILIEDEDERLDTLRKVFGIDKYKKIRENAMVAIRSLKEKKREIEILLIDLEDKKKNKSEKLEEIKILEHKIAAINPALEKLQIQIREKKDGIAKFERNIQELYTLRKEFEVKEVSLKNKISERQRNNLNMETYSKQLEDLKKEVVGKEVKDLTKELKDIQNEIFYDEKKLREVADKISELKVKKMHSVEAKNKIIELDECPMCEQNVGVEHKKRIETREDEKIGKIETNMNDFSSRVEMINLELGKKRADFEFLRKQESLYSVLLLKKKNIVEKEKMIVELTQMNDQLKKDIGEINVSRSELMRKVELFKDVEEQYKQLKLEVDSVERDIRKLEMEKVGYETEKKSITNLLVALDNEIMAKEKKKERMSYISEMQNWLEEGFLNLMTVMEKHVMANVYAEFNSLFQQWFNLLIEDETLNVRLDDTFTPLVDQDGYEIEISSLSGGEKTSAALAYRLALNKVVNDLMSGIMTKDLIILDEPTDGFSSEQLDRVRDVLDQIGTSQTIIVSHEQKIEGFVDNVIRIQKNEHISSIQH